MQTPAPAIAYASYGLEKKYGTRYSLYIHAPFQDTVHLPPPVWQANKGMTVTSIRNLRHPYSLLFPSDLASSHKTTKNNTEKVEERGAMKT